MGCPQVKELFELYDKDQDESLSLNELAIMLQDIGNKITALPTVCFPLLSRPTSCNCLTRFRPRKLPLNKANTLGRNYTD